VAVGRLTTLVSSGLSKGVQIELQCNNTPLSLSYQVGENHMIRRDRDRQISAIEILYNSKKLLEKQRVMLKDET
jgi:uncharacterized protein YuzE